MTDPSPPPAPGGRARVVSIALAFGLLILGLTSIAAVVWVTAPGGSRMASAPSAIGGPFRLTAHDGRTITEKDIVGRPTLVFFGFTHCPDICPTKLFEITQILERMGRDAERVNVLFVTVDPERDTRDLLTAYLGSFHPRIVGLTGDDAAVREIMRAYRAFARKVQLDRGGYTMDHTALVYLMDKAGAFVSSFAVDRDPQTAAADLRRFL